MIGFSRRLYYFFFLGLQTFTLLKDGEFWFAAVNMVGSNLLGC